MPAEIATCSIILRLLFANSMDMAVDSALGIKRSSWSVSITATDVSTRALTAARKAEYPESELSSMAPDWVKNYMGDSPAS